MTSNARRAAIATLLSIVVDSGLRADSTSTLTAGLAFGPYAVGFQALEARSAELLPSIPTRAIEVVVWYPVTPSAEATAHPPLSLADYLRAAPDLRERSRKEGVEVDDLAAVLATAIAGDPTALSPAQAKAILATPLAARRDAPARPGKHPLVLWSSRYGTTAAQCVLSEYLASHGLVVGFARPTEERWRLPFELSDAAARADELENQVVDLRGGLAALRALPFVDPETTAVLAWSYAGEAAIRLARTDRRIGIVVALSSNPLAGWVYQHPATLAALADGPLDVPVVTISEAVAGDGTRRQRPAIWNALPRGSAFLALPGLAHGSFNVIEGLIPAAFGLARVQPCSRPSPEGKGDYAAIARTVQHVLATHVAGGALARSNLLDLLPTGSEVELVDRPTPPVLPFATTEIAVDPTLRLTADWYAPERPGTCLLLLHQSGSSRGEYRAIGPWLQRRGFGALAVDLRTGNRDRWNGVANETALRTGAVAARERGDIATLRALADGVDADIAAAIGWLGVRAECAGGVIPWGSSFSANRAIQAAAAHPDRVRAVIAFSPGEYDPAAPQRMRAISARLTRPTLVVWGRGEAEVVAGIPEAIPSRKSTYASPLGFHGSSILFDDPVAWSTLVAFLGSLPADG